MNILVKFQFRKLSKQLNRCYEILKQYDDDMNDTIEKAGPGQKKEGAESSGRPFGGRCGAGAGRGVEQSRVEGWEQRGRWCSRDKI